MALRGVRQIDVAAAVSERLPEGERFSELALSQIATKRRVPSPELAVIISAVLGCTVEEIFPDLGKEVSKVRKSCGTKKYRCRKCGQFCGEQWGSTDSDKMSKRAESLLCERCTLSDLDPTKGGNS